MFGCSDIRRCLSDANTPITSTYYMTFTTLYPVNGHYRISINSHVRASVCFVWHVVTKHIVHIELLNSCTLHVCLVW